MHTVSKSFVLYFLHNQISLRNRLQPRQTIIVLNWDNFFARAWPSVMFDLVHRYISFCGELAEVINLAALQLSLALRVKSPWENIQAMWYILNIDVMVAFCCCCFNILKEMRQHDWTDRWPRFAGCKPSSDFSIINSILYSPSLICPTLWTPDLVCVFTLSLYTHSIERGSYPLL